jgi:hypothetical protein
MIRYLLRLAAAAALLLLLAAPALAQGRLIITDPGGRLNRDALQRAAQPLIDRGAEVAIYLVQSGRDSDFVSRLSADGLVSGSQARTRMVAIYVSIDDRFSAIRYGDAWNAALDVSIGDTKNYERIRTQVLNPSLSDKNFTDAFGTTLAAVNKAIANPPSPNAPIDTTPIAAGGLAVATAVAGGALYASRRRAAKIRADGERRLKDAREGAATLIADLGQRFRNAEEKAQYDQVSYAAPDVERLRAAQGAAQARFVKVQTSFDDVGERLDRDAKPDLARLAAAATAYDEVRAGAEAVSADIAAVDQIRAELDELARTAPEEIARAKKS